MKKLKVLVGAASSIVLLICVYAFLLGNRVFRGEFENDAICWYFLAKGIFCSLGLSLWMRVLERLPGSEGG
jgi:hypothetical protein